MLERFLWYTFFNIFGGRMHDYIPVFPSVLGRAARATWRHKGLWLFGFLAGIAQTGAVTNDVLRMAPKLEPGTFSWQTLEDAWNGLVFGKAFISGLITGSPAQIILTLLACVVFVLLSVLVIVGSQHLILQGAHRHAKNRPHTGLAGLVRELQHLHLWRITAVDILLWLATSLVLVGGGVLMRNIIAAVPDAQIFAAIGTYLILLPFVFALSSVGVLTIVHIIRHDSGITEGLHRATTFFAQHWLITMEFSAILFMLNFLVTALLGVFFLLFAGVVSAIFSAGITSLLALAALFGSAIVFLVVFIVFVGGMTTLYNYSAWTEFVARLNKKPVHARVEHVAARVRSKMRRR